MLHDIISFDTEKAVASARRIQLESEKIRRQKDKLNESIKEPFPKKLAMAQFPIWKTYFAWQPISLRAWNIYKSSNA
jgi:hypothetical protein